MGAQKRNKAFPLTIESAEYLGNLGTMPLLHKWFAKKEWRTYLQIHRCLSMPLGKHLSIFQLGTVRHGKVRHTQNSQAQQSVTFAVLEHCLHGAFPVCSPPDSSRSSDFVFHRPPALPQVHFMVIVNKEQCYTAKKSQIHHQPLISSWNPLNNPSLTCLSASGQDHFKAYQPLFVVHLPEPQLNSHSLI